MKITPAVFEAYLKCPTKCWLRATGETASGNTYAEWVEARNAAYRATETARLIAAAPHDEVALSPSVKSVNVATWRLASSLVIHRESGCFVLESDVHMVERVPGEGSGKAARFIPIRFISANKLGKDNKLLLAFDALLLSEEMKREISLGKIVHGDGHTTLKVKTAILANHVRECIGKIAALVASPTAPELVLNRHCPECEFRVRCRRNALEQDDLSLLAGMSPKERSRHRSKGIFTVNQLSYTFRPRRSPKRAKNPPKPRYLALQALAIREKTVYIHGTPILPQSTTHIYLDIEGLPDRDFYYLIGALIDSGDHEVFHSFWVDNQANESRIFEQFIESLNPFEDFRIFHFGDYETIALRRMRPSLSERNRERLDYILGKCTNVLSAIYSHVYFPTFSNNLKAIGECIGADRSTELSNGLDSIIWRSEWENGAKSDLKERLVDYNRHDCATLRRVTAFVVLQASSAVDGKIAQTKVRRTDDLNKAHPRWQIFSQREYALKDLEHITKCSYFDYQREKVLVRTDCQLRKINKKQRKLQRTKARPNQILDIRVKKCVVCGSKKITPGRAFEHWLFDLKFSKSGVKRWITQTKCPVYYCLKRHRKHSAWPAGCNSSKHGHCLVSWCIYWHVIGGLNMRRVNRSLGDFFGLFVSYSESHRFKAEMRSVYGPLYAELLQSLLHSPVLHIDETSVNLRGEAAYVWVLACTDKVYFFYRPSREGDFLEKMLAPFQGILISDFFTAYDSLPCRQQKCLAHLVRDIDDDLFRSPFDTELKEIGQKFAVLMKSIVRTIDRFGLKRRHLLKHTREACGFLREIAETELSSELASKYKKRFAKSGAKMFTFLDYDGVPWNNNNAEHAIKFFAKFRQQADGRFTQKSLGDYLVLASVFTTCEFNNVNPLRFLLSKETTLSGLFRMAGRESEPFATTPIVQTNISTLAKCDSASE